MGGKWLGRAIEWNVRKDETVTMPGAHQVTITLTVASPEPASPGSPSSGASPVPSVAHPGPSSLPVTGFALPFVISLALVLILVGAVLCRIGRGVLLPRRLP